MQTCRDADRSRPEWMRSARSPSSRSFADLVLHQRDERADDQRGAAAREPRELVAERLAGARRHHQEDVRARRRPRGRPPPGRGGRRGSGRWCGGADRCRAGRARGWPSPARTLTRRPVPVPGEGQTALGADSRRDKAEGAARPSASTRLPLPFGPPPLPGRGEGVRATGPRRAALPSGLRGERRSGRVGAVRARPDAPPTTSRTYSSIPCMNAARSPWPRWMRWSWASHSPVIAGLFTCGWTISISRIPLSVASRVLPWRDDVLAAEQGLDDLRAGRRRAEPGVLHRLGELAVVERLAGGLHGGQQRGLGEALGRPGLLGDGADVPHLLRLPLGEPRRQVLVLLGEAGSASLLAVLRLAPPWAAPSSCLSSGRCRAPSSPPDRPACRCCGSGRAAARRRRRAVDWRSPVITVVTDQTWSSCQAERSRRQTRS